MNKKLSLTILISILIFSACSQKAVENGAAGATRGAIGASMIGALTDLIIDGKVNTYRLQRNLVAGGLAGGAVGVASTSSEPKKIKKVEKVKEDTLKRDIGVKNNQALEHLISCELNDAYRITLESEKSQNKNYELASYIIQALTDKDRNNQVGVNRAVETFILKDDKDMSIETASIELNKIYDKLKNERRIRGLKETCN